MKKSDWVAVVIIMAIVFGICIAIYFSTDEDVTTQHQKEERTKLDEFNSHVTHRKEVITEELAKLKMTAEMETALSRRVDLICMLIGLFALVALSFVGWMFYINGYGVLVSILNTSGIVALTFPILSIFLWKVVDFNDVVTFTRKRIMIWLNKRYGHTPSVVTDLQAL